MYDYLQEENTMFIYFDSFESDPTLYYKETDLKPIYDRLRAKTKSEHQKEHVEFAFIQGAVI